MKYFQEADFPHYYIIITNCLPSVNSKKVKSGVSPPPPVGYLCNDYFICGSVTLYDLLCSLPRCIADGAQPWDAVVTGKAAAYLGRFAVFIGTADDYITFRCGTAAEH